MSAAESVADSPLALQLAARVEKLDPPLVDDVLAGAALAVIRLISDERSQPGGAWHDAVSAWNGSKIRKLMRRGRASAWERAQSVPGVTVVVGTAEVRAFVPGPMASAPTDLAKLQIQTPPLDQPDRADVLPEDAARPGVLVIAVTPDVDMSWGKLAAQCAHAGQRLWERTDDEARSRWQAAGNPIAIVRPTATLWPDLLDGANVQIHDGGFTEIPAGTLTTIAFWAAAP